MISGISFLRRLTSLLVRVLLQISLKNLPNYASASYIWSFINPLTPIAKRICKRMWQSWVFNPWSLCPSAQIQFAMLEANLDGNLTPRMKLQNTTPSDRK
jgi:hypothetical protein